MANWEHRWLPYFTEKEFTDGDGNCQMDPEFMDLLLAIRLEYNKPMVISSGYRSPEYNRRIGGSKESAHMEGKAADILVSGANAIHLVHLALQAGMTGLGVSQKGPHQSRFLHLDLAGPTPNRPRPHLWSY